MEFLELAKRRYSCRSFNDQVVSDEVLNKILEAGRIAPTARNSQPQKIYVIKGNELLEKVDTVTKCRYNAPIVLAIGYDHDVVFGIPGCPDKNFGEIDNAIVITHMILQAEELGVQSCWVGAYEHGKAEEVLGLPSNVELTALLPIGYASEKGVPSERHADKKPLSETVKFL
ncbi:MAG: nitroreductase family protein [Bacillota bacterium]|nr:nitroreductase family protein [Bacillota bacterium]